MSKKFLLAMLTCVLLTGSVLWGCTMPAPITATLPGNATTASVAPSTPDAAELHVTPPTNLEAVTPGEAPGDLSDQPGVLGEQTTVPSGEKTAVPLYTLPPTPTQVGAVAATPMPATLLEDVAGLASRFVPQPGTPALTNNFVRPEHDCNYLGVGGQVFNLNGDAITGLIIEVRGTLAGNEVLKLGLTGGAVAFGPGGYEIMIADRPVESNQALSVQLFDVSGIPISAPVLIDTSSICTENLVVVNFHEERIVSPLYLPFVAQNGQMDIFLPNVNR